MYLYIKLGARPLDGRVFFYSLDVVDDIGCARASKSLYYFRVKAVNALFTGSRMNNAISPTRNLHFCALLTAPNSMVSAIFQPSFVHSSTSSSSKHLLGSGFCKLDRQPTRTA